MRSKLINYLTGLTPRRRAFGGFLLGLAGVFGLAPFFIWPAYIIACAGFLLLLYTSITKKQLFWTGWAFAFGYFTLGLYWISLALHVDWGTWWWLTPFAAIGLPIYLSVYYGLAALCLSRFKDNFAFFSCVAVIAFTMAEYFRSLVFTGFPWNLPSYIWVDSPIAQNLTWIGAYGMNIFVFASAATFAAAFYKKRSLWLTLVILGGLYGYGLISLSGTPDASVLDSKTVMVVQPNIAQVEKWDRSKQSEHFQKTVQLSTTADGLTPADVIVWPETAITFKKTHLKAAQIPLDNMLGDGQVLLSGITDMQVTSDMEFDYYNSMVVLDDGAEPIDQYNKHHLVPFGEYVPMRNFLKFGGLAQAISSTGDFKPGPGPQVLTLPNGLKISPLICYEVIFPGQVAPKDVRPDVLINITNDGWYLKSTGPYQHLAMSRARAIEEGLPLIRAANTGVSAVIDAKGRIVLELPLQQNGTILTAMPQTLSPTLYARFGNSIFLMFLLVFTAIIGLARYYEKSSK